MGDEIDPSVLQATQQKLGKFIQKPQLTDKLLKRPPFRFVHDIVTVSIKQYGVFDNVFTKQELNSDNIKEKEEKIAFLQKLISHVSNELGQELNVKPSKIVAGSEAEKTNELLQALATVLENKNGNNKKNSSNKKTSESVANSKGIEHNTPTKMTKPSNGTSNKPAAASKAAPAVASTKKTESTIVKKPTTKPTAKPAAKTSNIASKPAVKSSAPKADALLEPDTPKRKKSEAGISLLNHDLTNEINNEKDSTTSTKKLSASLSASRNKSAEDKSLVPFPGPELYSTLENEPVKDIETVLQFGINSTKQSPQMSPDLASTDSGITLEHPPSATLNGPRSMKPLSARPPVLDEGFDAADIVEENDTRHNNIGSIEAGKLSPPISAVKNTFEKPIAVRNNVDTNRPPSGNKGVQRPRSSRRPPSRTLRDRLSVIRQDTRPMSGQMPRVIIEGNTYSDDEEDRIVQAAVFDQTIDDLTQSGADQLLGGEQGKLVEEILSAQRQLGPVTEESGVRDTSASSAQVQHLKALIQEMAQSALPLGQLIPLIHEDIESMQQEWLLWKKEADTLEEQYNREKTALDGYLVKLEAELQELDKSIQEEQMKLNAEKASVFRSEKDVSLVISNFNKKR